jgi:hypothetical protein
VEDKRRRGGEDKRTRRRERRMTEAQSQSEVTAEPTTPCFVGIDVAKAWLDVGVRPSGAS